MTQQASRQHLVAPRRPMRRAPILAAVGLIFVAVFVLSAGTILGVSRASAMLRDIAETGRQGFLSLRADPASPEWRDLKPGDRVYWQVEASLSDADSSALSLELRSDGELVNAGEMIVSVTTCDVEFLAGTPGSAPACGGQSSVVLANARLASIAQADRGDVFVLAELRAGSPRYLLVSLGVTASASSQAMAGTSMRVGVGLHASGDSDAENHEPPLPLPNTGTDTAVLSLLGVGLATATAGALLLHRARRQA